MHAYKTHVAISFTHSRLLRYRAGAAIKPGSLTIEGDLAESWTQPSDTTYVFKLRRGVRFHAKPPVSGRELTAEDVKFTFERMLTEAGSNASMYRAIAKVDAVDRYTVRFALSEPFAWFLDMVASPMAGAIVARECVEKWGDLKKPEAVIGTGPWMLESYRPNVSLTMVRHPGYFVPGLPYIDRVELLIDEDKASRMAAFLAGRYDLGWEFPGTINRTDWVQIKDRLRQTRPTLRTAEFPSNVVNDLAMRTDQKPWSDVRVRQAVSMSRRRSRASAPSTGRSRPRSATGPCPSTGSARGPATTATIPPKRSACSRPRATRRASPPACASTPTARPCWSTPCSSCSST